MLKRLIIISLFVSLACTGSLAATSWEAQVSTSQEVLNGVYFTGARSGWVVGDGGTILKTADRGQTWTTEASGTASDLNGVFFYNNDTAWSVGQNKTVVAYNGTSWTPATITSPASFDFSDVFMTDVNTAWVVAGISFSGSQSDFRNLFYTTDNGSSWNSTTIRNTSEDPAIQNSFYSVYFFDASHGWLVGINDATPVPAGKVFKTTDGGANWTDVSPSGLDNISLRDAYFVSSQEGWVVGGKGGTPNYGYIYHTQTGGTTWEEDFTFSPVFFRGIDGVDSSSLWVSDRASVFKYESGSWSEDSPPISTGYFNGVAVQDQWNAWAVGGLLAAEGGPKRYIYKYVADPANLRIDRTLYISPTTYEVGVGFSGDNIQSNAALTIEAAAGLTVTTYEVAYESSQQKYRLDATVRVDPAVAVAGTHNFTVTNPDDATSASGTLVLASSPLPTVKPTAVPVPEGIFDPATKNTLSVLIGTPGELTASGLRAFGPVAMAADETLELIVYRMSNRQIAYRVQFTADPDGYTTVTLDKITDLGLDISEGVYNAIVVHPRFGKIGSGMIVVHYSQ
ncbi:WD40/YVTN/BNR-like repeat-containing protein [Candidatus Margulisiibacteriota bacterium]